MHWVEHGADMVVGRDGGHAKQALAVRHLPPFLQCALVGEERLALQEEQRKGRQADIRHAVGHLAAPLVGKGHWPPARALLVRRPTGSTDVARECAKNRQFAGLYGSTLNAGMTNRTGDWFRR